VRGAQPVADAAAGSAQTQAQGGLYGRCRGAAAPRQPTTSGQAIIIAITIVTTSAPIITHITTPIIRSSSNATVNAAATAAASTIPNITTVAQSGGSS